MNTLIVEDNSITRALLQRQIRVMGHEVVSCGEAEQALELCRHNCFPLIVLDLGLPGMDGFEFTRQIRALPQGDQSIILVITAYDATDYLEPALKAGVDDFLTKPVHENMLRARLMILEQHHRNLTKRKQAEEALRNAYQELETTQQELIQSEMLAALGEFAAGLAHEIRNPLANIYSSAQYCLKKPRSEEQLTKHLQIIFRNVERANHVMKDLLDFARPRKLLFTLSDIHESIRKACNLSEAKRVEHHVRLQTHFASSLPKLFLDQTLIEQALVNFILNSLDAMKDGGTLSITTARDDDDILVTITDTGQGISTQDLEKIVTPFYTTKPDGVGLGLSVTHRIIQAHHGKIDIQSQLHKGTVVTVKLPIAKDQ